MGDYKLSIELRKWLEVPNPNRQYGLDYKQYLEANSRKSLTTYRRLSELRYVFLLIGKTDAKTLTRKDSEDIVRVLSLESQRITNAY